MYLAQLGSRHEAAKVLYGSGDAGVLEVVENGAGRGYIGPSTLNRAGIAEGLLTVIGALGHDGTIAAMTIEAATDGAVFAVYLAQVLLPAPGVAEPDALIVMDNLSAHKTTAVHALITKPGSASTVFPLTHPI